MKTMKKFAIAGLAVISVWQLSSATSSRLSGAYLGQAPPGRTAVLFAPGDLSTADPEICISFAPDGKTLSFCSTQDGNAEIYGARSDGGDVRRLTFNKSIDTSPMSTPPRRKMGRL